MGGFNVCWLYITLVRVNMLSSFLVIDIHCICFIYLMLDLQCLYLQARILNKMLDDVTGLIINTDVLYITMNSMLIFVELVVAMKEYPHFKGTLYLYNSM